MSPPSSSLEDVSLKAELDIRIIIVSFGLMFIGTLIPSIPEYQGFDLLWAIVIGALFSIVGNFLLLYAQRNKLIKVLAVEVRNTIGLKDEVVAIVRKAKDTT